MRLYFHSGLFCFPIGYRMLVMLRYSIFCLLFFAFITNASAQEAVVSSYFNAGTPTSTQSDEWTELLVIQDNLDMRNWTIGDNNSAQTAWMPTIMFNNDPFWANMRAGTIIVIWHRSKDFSGIDHTQDIIQNDGYIELWANDGNYFTGGDFLGNTTLNIANGGDMVQLKNASGNHVHALGHIVTIPVSGSFNGITGPKLNHTAQLPQNSALIVLPGTNIAYYGTLTPQSGNTYTAISASPDVSRGLPNSNATWLFQNSNFWRATRQPGWVTPTLTATPNGAYTQVNLSWNTCTDPYSADGTQGYLILRNSTNSFTDPTDGTTYVSGETIGTATVAGIISSSQTTTFSDNYPLSCGENVYYRVYAFRFSTDESNGNNYNLARGRAYNETNYASSSATGPAAPIAPTSAISDRDNFCADDAGNIVLTASGGAGTNLEWFTGSCGGSLIGTGNNFSVPSPVVTTIYYVRWASTGCTPSACVSVTVTVSDPPTLSDAGPDQSKCGVLTTNLAGNIPATGNGLWTQVSGPLPVTFGNTSQYNTSVNAPVQGIYVFRWTIINGAICPSSFDEVSVEFSNAVTVVAGSNSPVCTGGAIQLTSSIAGATYAWSGPNLFNSTLQNPLPIANAQSVNSGLYSVTVSNIAGGCPNTSGNITVLVNITPVTPPISSQNVVGNQQDVCTGSQLAYSIEPPTSGSEYNWNLSGGGFIIYTASPALINISWSMPGSYVLSVTETTVDGCTGTPVTLNIVVNSISAASVSVLPDNNPACTGVPVTFTAYPVNGGTSPQFIWFVNGIQAANPGPPTFTYTPSDGDQVYVELSSSSPCALPNPVLSEAIIMSVNTTLVPAISISTTTNPACSGSTVIFTSDINSGGNNPVYHWKKNGLNVGSDSPTYSDNTLVNNDLISCELTSDESCASPSTATSNTVTMNIASILNPEISIAADNNPGCTGNTVSFWSSISHGGNMPVYLWKRNGLDVGTNSPVYSDNNFNNNEVVSCILTSNAFCISPSTAQSNEVTLTVNPVPAISGITLTNPTLCGGSDGTISLSGLIPSTLYLVLYNFNGLADTLSLLTDGSGLLTLTGLSAGNYSNISVILNGCTSVPENLNLNDPGAATAPTIVSDSYSVCPGENVSLTATGCNGTITWNNGETGYNILVYPTVTTSYTATCIENGCTSLPSDPVEVTVKAQPEIAGYTMTPPSTFCNKDGTITLLGLIPNTEYIAYYNYNGHFVTFTSTSDQGGWLHISGCEPTTYFNITVMLDGCRSDSIDVSVSASNTPQPPDISSSEDTICPGQEIVLTARLCNGEIIWSDGSTGSTLTTSPEISTTFTATCTENSCTSAEGNPITVVVEPAEIASIDGLEKVCVNGQISLYATGNATSYQWMLPNGNLFFEQNFTKDSVTISDAGIYKLITTDNSGCTDSDSIVVSVHTPAEFHISSYDFLCAGKLHVLEAGSEYSSYLWQDGSTASSFAAIDEGEYWVQITDTNNCKSSDTAWLTYCPGDIFVPNAFTPNKDGINDTFRPVNTGNTLLDFSMIIFNRWGQKIFETNDFLSGWDGTMNSNELPSGLYTYVIIYRLADPSNPDSGNKTKLRGTVTLVR